MVNPIKRSFQKGQFPIPSSSITPLDDSLPCLNSWDLKWLYVTSFFMVMTTDFPSLVQRGQRPWITCALFHQYIKHTSMHKCISDLLLHLMHQSSERSVPRSPHGLVHHSWNRLPWPWKLQRRTTKLGLNLSGTVRSSCLWLRFGYPYRTPFKTFPENHASQTICAD